MQMRIQSGADLNELFRNPSINPEGWQLIRPEFKNETLKISGMIVSGNLNNRCVGLALSNSYNLIVLIEKINYRYLPQKIIECIELLYKHDIYVFSLGIRWIFESMEGNSLITNVLFGEPNSFFKLQLRLHHLVVHYDRPIQVVDMLQRFGSSIYWEIRSKNKIATCIILETIEEEIVQNLSENKIDAIIVFSISPNIIQLCENFGIIPIWIDPLEFNCEIARDITYYYARLMKIPIEYSRKKLRKLRKSGLDGI